MTVAPGGCTISDAAIPEAGVNDDTSDLPRDPNAVWKLLLREEAFVPVPADRGERGRFRRKAVPAAASPPLVVVVVVVVAAVAEKINAGLFGLRLAGET